MTIEVRTLVLPFAIAIAAVSVGAALFATVDSVSVGGRDCGSPIDPKSARAACAAELGHARAARAWTVGALGAGWAGATVTARRRREA